MEIIYIDSLFFLNLIINYLIILAGGRICSLTLKRLRYGLAAGVGALYSVAVVLPGMEFLSAAAMKLVCSVLMILIAYGGEKKLLKPGLVFYCISFAFGGAVYAAAMLSGVSITGGVFIPVSMKVLILSFALCYITVTIVFRRTGKKTERTVYRVDIGLGGKTASFTALQDTGNSLSDPISGAPVMVAEHSALSPLFPLELNLILARTNGDMMSAFTEAGRIPGWEGRFRLIPYSAVGVRLGLLIAFRPDSVIVDGRPDKDVLVALSATELCEDGEYAAII